MKYKIIAFIFVYHALVSEVSSSLGLTSDVITRASSPDVDANVNFIEALWVAVSTVINNLGSFFQLVAFQADIPPMFALFLVYPTSIIMVFIIVELIRG